VSDRDVAVGLASYYVRYRARNTALGCLGMIGLTLLAILVNAVGAHFGCGLDCLINGVGRALDP